MCSPGEADTHTNVGSKCVAQAIRRIRDLVRGWGGGGSDKRPSTDYLIVIVLMFCLTNPFFTRKKYSQNTYVCFTLRGSTEVLEPPMRRRASMGHI